MPDSPTVVVVNESTLLSEVQAWNITWALSYQARFQFGPAWQSASNVIYMPKGAKVPTGAWILHLLDTADVAGALGYHDEDGSEVPYSRVFVKTAQENGQQASEVASHELTEMLVDPHVDATAWDPKGSRLYAFEVGDPCQGNGYDVGAPEGRATGVLVADFVLPGWMDPNTPPGQQTDYRGALRGPFALGPQGYVSYTSALPPTWQQQLGEKANPKLVDSDDRIGRRAVLVR
jgi:hypothetical protein